MPITIEDARGTGISAGVNTQHRVLTSAITYNLLAAGSFEGTTYIVDAQAPTLTTTGESGILYIKNTDPDNILQLANIDISLGKGNVVGDTLIKIYGNPTGGTLLSAGTTVIPSNRNFGLNTPALATIFAGTEGKTITGGTLAETWILQNATFLQIDVSPSIPNGYSVAFSITPPAGNTSMKVNITLRVVYITPSDI